MIKKLGLPVLLALGCAALVQSLEAYKSDTRIKQAAHRTVAVAHIVEPPNDCTGECADGYRWAKEHAVNEESRCDVGTRAFRVGCANLVQDELLDRF